MSSEFDLETYRAGLRSDFEREWEKVSITIVEPQSSSLEALAIECRPSFLGNISAAYQFKIASPNNIVRMLCQTNLPDYNFFPRFFAHTAVNTSIPGLGTLYVEGPDLGFQNLSTYRSFGDMAAQAKSSPCYPLPRPKQVQSDRQGLQAASDFFEAVCEMEIGKTWTWYSQERWCDALDFVACYSYFWVYPDKQLITIYLFSDAS